MSICQTVITLKEMFYKKVLYSFILILHEYILQEWATPLTSLVREGYLVELLQPAQVCPHRQRCCCGAATASSVFLQ